MPIESRQPVRVNIISLMCECNAGEYLPVSNAMLTVAPQQLHQCTHCSDQFMVSGQPYPRVEYIPITKEADDGTT